MRMPRRHRVAVYVIVGVLWLSGCGWLYLDQFLELRGPFGAVPHPWQAPLLLIHGVAGVISLYLFGWIGARHILHWWIVGLRRLSGGSLAALFALLVVSGFALFFLSDDAWQHRTVLIHDSIGLAITLFAMQHWFLGRRNRRAAARIPYISR
jgi:hypothetical protein